MDIEALQAERERRLFEDWPVPAQKLLEVRATFREMIDALIANASLPDENLIMTILQQGVQRLNEIDDGFIGTIEREDLCDALYRISEKAGIEDQEWVDEFRDW